MAFAESRPRAPCRPCLCRAKESAVRPLDNGKGIALVIGAMKSGTSSLHEYLALHPEITMSKQKELNFFTHESWDLGLGWYSEQLAGDTKVRGESSPNYTKYPAFASVPARMHSVVPEAKLIYLVREPLSRIVSHYVHNLSHGRERRPLAVALRESQGYITPSLYHAQIERYLDYFDQGRILVIEQESLLKRRDQTLRRVFEFLDVRADFKSPGFENATHQTANKRKPTALGRLAHRLPGLHAARDHLPWPLSRNLEKPELDDATRNWLLERIQPDVEALRRFSGLALEGW